MGCCIVLEACLVAAAIPWLGEVAGALLGLAVGGGSMLVAIMGGTVVDLLRERDAGAAPQPAH